MKPFDGLEIWFVTGSQDLYGEEALAAGRRPRPQIAMGLDDARDNALASRVQAGRQIAGHHSLRLSRGEREQTPAWE